MASRTRLEEWQQFKYPAYQFNNVALFGISESQQNKFTGVSTAEFKQIAKLHYAVRNQTISDRLQAAGTAYQDSVMIVIRHNRDLASRDVLYVKIDDKLYRVINYSVNDATYNSVDLLTLSRVKKVS